MSATVNIEGVAHPRHAVVLAHVAPLVRLATRNEVRRAEYANLSGAEDPVGLLTSAIAEMGELWREQHARLVDVRDKCYGPVGHDWNGNDYCNRCGADGRA